MSFKLSLLDKEEYAWLKNSDFYLSFEKDEEDEEEDEEEAKEKGKEKENEKELKGVIFCSENTNSIKEFLKVGKFWIVNYYPNKFYDLLFKNKKKSIFED